MADDRRHDPYDQDTSLELPSLGSAFRRRRRGRSAESAQPAEPAEPAEGTESARDDSVILPPTEPVTGARSPGPAGLPETQPDTARPVLTATEEAVPRERRRIRVHLPGPLAAVLTGAVVGLALVGLTAAGLRVCSSMRGTSSCGRTGILLLLVITTVAILLGSLLLRIAGVPSHGSTSFLGVGLLVVLILLGLLPMLDEWWMAIAVPVLGMATYVASWWLTTTYVESGDRPR
jgi:hypothetical protein